MIAIEITTATGSTTCFVGNMLGSPPFSMQINLLKSSSVQVTTFVALKTPVLIVSFYIIQDFWSSNLKSVG